MTTKIVSAACTIVLAIALTGCSDATKKTFGLEANPPDAFTVGTQPPLSLPPELGALPPPNPGAPRPQQMDAAQAGANALDPANAITQAPSTPTPGEQALLDQAGPTPPAGIRAQVNQNALIASKPPGFVSSVMGNGPTPVPTVDAAAEQRRLQENAALGQPATNGATPQDSNQNPGFFGRIWNAF
jgi:hypothetical protein